MNAFDRHSTGLGFIACQFCASWVKLQVDIPQHLAALQAMMIDWQLDRHLLLIGNQGVGKNKLTDRFLGLLRLEREYVQLHRDTTVQSLTLQPMLQQGVVIYEDSPLVAAVRHGRVLVIDEADKAPLEVVCILKSLAEDGEFALGDGTLKILKFKVDIIWASLWEKNDGSCSCCLFDRYSVFEDLSILAFQVGRCWGWKLEKKTFAFPRQNHLEAQRAPAL